MMKNEKFTLKAFFILKINNFLISKFMMSKPGKETIAMHILLIILRSKGHEH